MSEKNLKPTSNFSATWLQETYCSKSFNFLTFTCEMGTKMDPIVALLDVASKMKRENACYVLSTDRDRRVDSRRNVCHMFQNICSDITKRLSRIRNPAFPEFLYPGIQHWPELNLLLCLCLCIWTVFARPAQFIRHSVWATQQTLNSSSPHDKARKNVDEFILMSYLT